MTIPSTPSPSGLPEEVHVRPAASRREHEEAYRLVYRNYRARGYAAKQDSAIRVSLHNALPQSITFVGVLRETVIATVCLLPDTPIGLPMQDIYSEEMERLRAQERTVTEVTMLADRRMEIQRTLPMLLQLMKLVFDYATLVLRANDLCITINPRHDAFYKRYLLFDNLGEERVYPSVENNPALARRLDLDRVREACANHRLLQHVFFEDRTPLDVLEGRYKWSCDDIRYFFLELTDTLAKAPAHAVDYLRQVRPDCSWKDWLKGTS